MPNAYLEKLRRDYDTLRTSIEGLQQTALTEERDLTPEELTSVRGMQEQGQGLHTQITQLTEIEVTNRAVQEQAARISGDATAHAVASRTDAQLTSVGSVTERGSALRRTSGTTAIDRDPGHYTRSAPNSFFGDLHRSRSGDDDAARRLAEHNRALSTGTGNAGAGIVPPALAHRRVRAPGPPGPRAGLGGAQHRARLGPPADHPAEADRGHGLRGRGAGIGERGHRGR
jgi:hypothetical protein